MATFAHDRMGREGRDRIPRNWCSRILESKPHPEMGYRACLGIIRLAAKYSPERVEHAAERALLTGAVSYQSIKSILRNGLDSQPPALCRRRRGCRRNMKTCADRSTSSKEKRRC